MKNSSNTLKKYFKDFIKDICAISEIYLYHGDLTDILSFLENCKEWIDLNDINSEDKARFLVQYVKLLQNNKFINEIDFEKEIEMLEIAVKLSESKEDKKILADAFDLIGTCIYSSGIHNGDFLDAYNYFNKALMIRDQSNDKLGLTKSFFNLGLYHENKKDSNEDDKQKAFEFYKKGLKIAIEEDFKLEQSYFYRHLAYQYQYYKNDLDKALDYHIKSKDLREEIGFNVYMQSSYFAIGMVYFFKEDYINSSIYFKKAYEVAMIINRVIKLRKMILLRGEDIETSKGKSLASIFYKQQLDIALDLNDKKGYNDLKKKIDLISDNKN